MTPLDLEILLHYHSRVTDIPWLSSGARIVPEVMDRLLLAGYLTRHPGEQPLYRPTALLHAFVTMLCATPAPKAAFVDPRNGRAIDAAA